MSAIFGGGTVIVFGALVVLLMLTVIIVLLSKRQLAEKYAVLWLTIGVAGLVVLVFPGLLNWLTRALHIELPSNLLFGGAILLLVGVALHLSWELSQAESEIRRLAEDSAINTLEIERLERRLSALEAGGSRSQARDGSPRAGSAGPESEPDQPGLPQP